MLTPSRFEKKSTRIFRSQSQKKKKLSGTGTENFCPNIFRNVSGWAFDVGRLHAPNSKLILEIGLKTQPIDTLIDLHISCFSIKLKNNYKVSTHYWIWWWFCETYARLSFGSIAKNEISAWSENIKICKCIKISIGWVLRPISKMSFEFGACNRPTSNAHPETFRKKIDKNFSIPVPEEKKVVWDWDW